MKVAFYRRGSYPAFDATAPGTFGGAEVHALLMATGLAARPGYHVTFVVGECGPPTARAFGNVSVISDCRPYTRLVTQAYHAFHSAGVFHGRPPWIHVHRFAPGLCWQIPLLAGHKLLFFGRERRSLPQVRELWNRGLDAACVFGATPDAADVVASCRRYGVRSIVFVMGDSQLVCRSYLAHRSIVDYSPTCARLMDYALMNADHIVVQTERQRALLKEEFGRDGVIIRNPVEVSDSASDREGEYVFWVGRADLVHKRSDRLLELAKDCPRIPFRAVVNPCQKGVLEQTRACAPSNLTIIERATHREVIDLMARAAILVNTSASEGFPNAFLQAASLGIPVVSLRVDPDGFCELHGCGIVCGDDAKRLSAEVSSLWQDSPRRIRIGFQAREYVAARHALPARIDELESLLRDRSLVAPH